MELSMVPYNDQVEAKPGRAELDRRQASAVAEAEAARYRECLRNHAAAIGGHTNDGCGEFMEGSASPLLCAACGCHRNFHRKELPVGGGLDGGELLGHPRQQYYLQHHYYQQNPHRSQPMVVYDGRYAAAAQMVAPMQAVVAAEEAGAAASARKRFRTRFTPEQKERMAEFAERRGWRLGGKREDEEELRRFCSEVGINRQVLKVWIHNHKHSLGSANACGGGGPKEEEEEVVVAEPATPATMTP